MTGKDKRQRDHFEIGDAVSFEAIRDAAEKLATSVTPKARNPKRSKRLPTTTKKRIRPKARGARSRDLTTRIERTLRSEILFDLAGEFRLPPGKRGPMRAYSEITVALWLTLSADFDSIDDTAAYFSHPLIWNHVATTLEKAWPNHPDRRVLPDRPMSRSQYIRHRSMLEAQSPGAVANVIEIFAKAAAAQALSMGYFPAAKGSLSNPSPTSVVSGDGTIIAALTDNIEGDLVVDENGVAQQARFDRTAVLNGKDENKVPFPAFNLGHLQVSDPEHANERVILAFGRADALGEAQTLERLLEQVQVEIPHLRHYCYDMAVQGSTIERLYKRGLAPIIKVPRNSRGEPASALIETRTIKGHSGRDHTIQLWALDGAAGTKEVANGDEFFVALTPKILRQPRTGTHQGFYEFPDHPLIHADLRGREIMIRLDGTTDSGRNRAQYLRWFNEHTDQGRALLGLREGTESEHAIIRRTLPWNRARSIGEFRILLDLLGYFVGRNIRAAMAHEERTGRNPLRTGPPPQVDPAAAA